MQLALELKSTEYPAAFTRVMLVSDGAPQGPKLKAQHPWDLAELVAGLVKGEPQESVITVALDARRNVLAVVRVSMGSLTQSLAHPREVFRVAFLANAAAVVVAHTHPSGDPSPSTDDHVLTRRLREAAEILGVPLLDHIIVGTDGNAAFYSYAQSSWPC
jgi:DNA repair protein RadC